MHYVRTSSGSMMAVSHKSSSQTTEKKRATGTKAVKKPKKEISANAK